MLAASCCIRPFLMRDDKDGSNNNAESFDTILKSSH